MTKRLRLKTGIRRLILSLWLCMICVTMYPQSTLLVQRNGLQDGGTCGLVDNLTHTYNGTKLIKISDRHIGFIEYDSFNNPCLIQFTDGSVTEYVYDASGVKLKTLHRTAVPGIEVPYGTVYEHTASTVLSSDSTLYAGPFVLSGDSLRYKYDGGSVMIPLDGSPVKPCFYALDHLGSVRLVVSADGQIIERNDYYPSGCLITENIDGETVILPYKYNGKELDPMHGLYTYDYGARQYDPATMLWDRMDPLGEENPEVSPYVYCGNNPMNAVDMDGRDYWSTNDMNQIINFINAIGRGQNQFDFSDWQHATDAEITGRLTYNDETGKFYTSYAEFSNGEIVVTGKSFDANLKPVSASGYGYPGAFVYEPLEGFWLNLNHILNGTTYYDGFINWNVNTEGRINGVVPITGTAPTFGKGNKFVGGKQKMGHSLGKTTRDHDRQNKQVRSLAKKYKLTKKETDVLHDEISHQGFGYHEIEEFIHDFFGK